MSSPGDEREGETMRLLPYSTSTTWSRCRDACIAESTCFAFTFFSHSHSDATWEGECVGRTDYMDVSVTNVYATSGERISDDAPTREKLFCAVLVSDTYSK